MYRRLERFAQAILLALSEEGVHAIKRVGLESPSLYARRQACSTRDHVIEI